MTFRTYEHQGDDIPTKDLKERTHDASLRFAEQDQQNIADLEQLHASQNVDKRGDIRGKEGVSIYKEGKAHR